MWLVFIIDNPRIIGGGDYAMFKYAEHLARRRHDVTIFGLHRNEFIDGIRPVSNLRIHLRGGLPPVMRGVGVLNRVWDHLYTRAVVERCLRGTSGRPDFLIGYLRRSAVKATRLGEKYGIKTANFVFESPAWLSRQLGPRFTRHYRGRLKQSWDAARRAYLRSTVLFPLSELVRKEVAEWLGREVAPPVYPGVDIPEEGSRPAREEHILYLGRLDANKNVAEIIEAVARLADPPPLVIAGSGHDEKELRDLAAARGLSCRFPGRVSDAEKWRLIRECLFMVFPSSFEGFGIPPAEALVCGRPCICSDIPILKEIYRDKVEFVPEHDVGALEGRIRDLLARPGYRARRGAEGRAFVLERYTWEHSARRMERYLLSYAGQERKER